LNLELQVCYLCKILIGLIFYHRTHLSITKKIRMDIEIEVDVPFDIVDNEDRFTKVKEGILKSVSKGLYEEGVAFRIRKTSFEVKENRSEAS
jgi:hypothetical protein